MQPYFTFNPITWQGQRQRQRTNRPTAQAPRQQKQNRNSVLPSSDQRAAQLSEDRISARFVSSHLTSPHPFLPPRAYPHAPSSSKPSPTSLTPHPPLFPSPSPLPFPFPFPFPFPPFPPSSSRLPSCLSSAYPHTLLLGTANSPPSLTPFTPYEYIRQLLSPKINQTHRRSTPIPSKTRQDQVGNPVPPRQKPRPAQKPSPLSGLVAMIF